MRIILGIIVCISVIQGWWLIAVPVCMFGSWKYPLYIETIIAGVAFDSLFGYHAHAGVYGYIGTIISALILISILILKKVMR
jgi:hypothetical protein